MLDEEVPFAQKLRYSMILFLFSGLYLVFFLAGKRWRR